MEQWINGELEVYKNELYDELRRIMDYWVTYTPDAANGGFYGRINNQNQVISGAPKGSVLNTRILWSFAAAYNLTKSELYLQYASTAYLYIGSHFIDKGNGGVFWTVSSAGARLDTKKQVYAIAFTIYALSEYYRASALDEAKYMAINLYHTLLKYTYDKAGTGYFEAFSSDWQPIAEVRLSAKDRNDKKTMNTHLHLVEAYTNLYRIWPDSGLHEQVKTLLHNFLDHFIDMEKGALGLFFNEGWNKQSGLVSFGHNIEATWLLQESAEIINDQAILGRIKKINIAIAEATITAIDGDGGLWYEYDPDDNELVKEKHWWVQAEAMVGFYNTWQISGDEKYLRLSMKIWGFVKNKILDKQNGEWFWGVDKSGGVMQDEDKVGLWKCPYHNSRACIEIIKRISSR